MNWSASWQKPIANLLPRLSGPIERLTESGAAQLAADGVLELHLNAAEAARGGSAAPLRPDQQHVKHGADQNDREEGLHGGAPSLDRRAVRCRVPLRQQNPTDRRKKSVHRISSLRLLRIFGSAARGLS